jgi:putative spermidine/putrescine transport system ATP-binding protein
VADAAHGRIAVDDQEIVAARGIADGQAGQIRSVALRPEAVSLTDAGGERNRMRGTIEEVNFLGSVVRIRVRFKENAISLDTFNNPSVAPPQRGQPVTVCFAREDLLVLEGAEAG